MVVCPFASETELGTLCLYRNGLCGGGSGWNCGTMEVAVINFRALLKELKGQTWTEDFMKETIKKE